MCLAIRPMHKISWRRLIISTFAKGHHGTLRVVNARELNGCDFYLGWCHSTSTSRSVIRRYIHAERHVQRRWTFLRTELQTPAECQALRNVHRLEDRRRDSEWYAVSKKVRDLEGLQTTRSSPAGIGGSQISIPTDKLKLAEPLRRRLKFEHLSMCVFFLEMIGCSV